MQLGVCSGSGSSASTVHTALKGYAATMVTNLSHTVQRARGRLCFLVRGLDGGGAQRDAILLANELQRRGIETAIVTLEGNGPLRDLIAPDVPLIDLGEGTKLRLAFAGPALHSFLKRGEPRGVVSSEASGNTLLVLASRFLPKRRRLWTILREVASPLQARRDDPYWQNRLAYRLAPWIYPLADLVVTFTQGVRNDLIHDFRVPAEKIVSLGTNTVVTAAMREEIASTARSPLQGHIVAVGRLSAEKGFITLLNAFAVLARKMDCRLTIVGEGAQRPELEALIRQLGLSDRVSLNGHSSNPLRILATAALFVSASTHEGFGNALIEAMARGVPIVATDAPHGPREILDGGRYGILVPVGDIPALAEAMKAMLENPMESGFLQQRAAAFSVEAATDTFIIALDRAGLALAPADRKQLDLKSGR